MQLNKPNYKCECENCNELYEVWGEIEKSYIQGEKIKIGTYKYKNIYVSVE